MASRITLPFLLVVCLVGLGWLLGGQEQQPSPFGGQSETNRDGPAPAPALSRTALGLPASAAPADKDGSRMVPAWLRGKPIAGALRGRLIAWIQSDPLNLDALIDEILMRAAQGDAYEVFETARHLFTMLRDMAGQLDPLLHARLRGLDPSVRHRAALLGATYGLTWGGGGVRRNLEDLVRTLTSSEEDVASRSFAAGALCLCLDQRPDGVDAIDALLGELAETPNFELLLLLQRMVVLPKRAGPFVPTLLEIRPRLAGLEGSEELILQIIAYADPGNPGAKDLFVRGLGHPKAAVRALAQIVLAERDGKDPVGALESASAAVRVEGVKLLLRRSTARDRVARDRVADLLLAALADGDVEVRDRAITLLPSVSPQPRRTLPVVRALLTGEERDRWISGTKALGVLSASSRQRDDILQMLFVAARLPNSEVRILAVQSLMAYDGHAQTVVPVLAGLLRDTDVEVRRVAVDGLGAMSSHDGAAEVHLQAALSDSDASVRDLAKSWLDEDD